MTIVVDVAEPVSKGWVMKLLLFQATLAAGWVSPSVARFVTPRDGRPGLER